MNRRIIWLAAALVLAGGGATAGYLAWRAGEQRASSSRGCRRGPICARCRPS